MPDQDAEALTALARRRCADEKAGARRAALQLLEALLLLRCSGAGGVPSALPAEADVAVLQAAAADPLVTNDLAAILPREAALRACIIHHLVSCMAPLMLARCFSHGYSAEASLQLEGRSSISWDVAPGGGTLKGPAMGEQVSVRKAALGAACGLLRALPDQAALCALWVGAALPLARDVEASLQEALLDSLQEFLIAPAGAGTCWPP